MTLAFNHVFEISGLDMGHLEKLISKAFHLARKINVHEQTADFLPYEITL